MFSLFKAASVRRYLHRLWIFIRFFSIRLYNRWNDDSVFFSAAAISFNVLITIIPLGLMILMFSGIALQEDEGLQQGLTDWLDTANPLIPENTRNEIERTILTGNAGIPGIIGFGFLLWLVSRLFGTIRTAFDRIFDVSRGRNIVLGKLYDFFLALLVAFSFVSSLIFSTMASLVVDSPVGDVVSRWPLIGQLTGGGIAQVLGITFTMLLFFTLFKAAPNRKVGVRQALLATAVAMVFTSLGTQSYIWVINHPGWGVVYGSLARLMATFFLLYWECVILLGAAEVSQIAHEWRKVARTMKNIR